MTKIKRIKRRQTPPPPKSRYKIRCDNHPDRSAAYAFIEASTGERRGLCADCFTEERKAALRSLRPKIDPRKARAMKYARGLTTSQLLKKLDGDDISPGRLARALGIDDSGGRWRIANAISKKYGPRRQ